MTKGNIRPEEVIEMDDNRKALYLAFVEQYIEDDKRNQAKLRG